MEKLFSPALWRYNQLYCQESQLYHETAVRLGLSESQFWILYALCDAEKALSQRDLSIGTGMPKQTVHSAVGQMLRAGYLQREERPGRECGLRLTPEGKRLASETVIPVILRENDAFADLTPQEREMLLRLNEKYGQRLAAHLADLPKRNKE